MSDDGQLNIQQQINQAVRDRSKLFAEQTNMLTAQARIAKQLCKALECQELDDLDERLNRIKENEGIEKLTEDVKKSGQAARSATDDFGALKKAAAAGALAGFVGGVKSAFGGAIKTIRNVANAIGGIISAVSKVGLSIISIPFKLFGGLISMAQQGGGGGDALRQAYEDVRKEFGSLATNEGKALKGTLNDLKGQMGDLAGTGLRMGKIFGYGREGMAEFLKMNAELATALGGAFNMVKDVIEKNAVALAMYRKGLGMTAEAQGSIIAKAKAFGKDPMEEMRKFGDAAVRLGAKFGISSKVMGKNMSKLVEDFDHFGTFGPEMLGQVVAQAQRLGVEVEKLTGIMDAFSSFDSAHDRSAKLYQMFGMNIDAMKMMKEQDPAAQLAMMQEAFAKSGKSVEGMHHAQLKQLASLTNLDTKTAAFAFSQRGLTKSYGDVQKEMDKKHKKEKTQAEIMKDISKNIAKLVKQGGGGGFKGFFDAFSKGFQKGILKSKEFRKIFRNINKSLRIVYNSGIRVGNMFVKIFPGMKKFTTGLGGLFDPKHMKKLMRELEGGFKQLFKALQKDPDSGWEPFFKRTKKAFMRFFGVKAGFGKLMLVGLKIIGRALSGLLGQMIRGLVPMLSEGLNKIAEFVRTGSLEAITNNLDGSIFKPIVEALIAVGPDLLDAFKNLWDAIYTKARPYLMTGLKYLMTYIFGKMMLTMVMSTVTGAISATIAGGGLKMLMNSFGTGLPGGGGGPPEQGVKQAASLKKTTKSIVKAINQAFKSLAKLDVKAMLTAGYKMSVMVVSFLMPLTVLIGGLIGISILMGQFAPMDFTLKIMSMMLAVGALFLLSKTIEVLGKINKGAILKGLPAVVGLTLIVGGIALLMAAISKAFDDQNPLNLVVMTAALALFLGTVMAVAIASIAIGALLGGAQAAVLIPMAAIGLVALVAVAVATGALLASFQNSFGNITPGEADTLLKVSKAAINVVNAVATSFTAALKAGGSAAMNVLSKLTGNDPVTKGIENLTAMTKPLGTLIVEIIKNIAHAAKNAASFERVAKAFGNVMKAVAPIFKVAADLTSFAMSALDEGVEPEKISKMMDKAGATTEKIAGSVQTFIKGLSKITMNEQQIKTATALAPIIQAAASMLGAISSPMTALASAAKESVSTSGTTKVGYSAVYGLAEGEAEVGFNRVNKSFASGKFSRAADTVGNIIPKILESLAGSMGKMIDSIKGISGKLSRREARQVVRTMKVLGEVFKSMAAATGVVKDILGLKTTQGESKSMSEQGVKGGASFLGTGASFENVNKTEVVSKQVNMMQQLEMVTGLLLGETLAGVKDPKLHGGLLGIGIKFIDRMKGYKDKIPDMNIASQVAAAYSLVFNKLVDGFSVKSKNMKSALDSVRKAEDLVDAYKKIMSIQEFADIDKAQKVYDTIVKLNSAFQEASANVHVMEPFKGGKLKVSHNVENINLTMTVSIDSRQLATDLVKVTELNAPFTSQRISTEGK